MKCRITNVLASALLAMAWMASSQLATASPFVGVNDGGGTGWNTETILPSAQNYRYLSVDRVQSATIYGITTADRPYNIFWSGASWIEGALPAPVGNSYLAITADATQAQYTYASRTTGGIDAIHVWSGDWYTDSLWSGATTYGALTVSTKVAQTVYAAKSTGGMDRFDPTTSIWEPHATTGLESVTFISLSVNPNASNNFLFGIGTNGLAYTLSEGAPDAWTLTQLPTPGGRTYTSITSSNFTNNFAFASRTDGGVDAIHIWPSDGNWYTDNLVATGNYGAVAADKFYNNYIYAAVPEPSTVALLSVSALAVACGLRRRKMS